MRSDEDPSVAPLQGKRAGGKAPSTTQFDFKSLTARERYKLLIGAVVPRPIALVTTVDAEGRVNAAPFSFFNCLSADPPILALGVEYRADGRSKDTGRNVRDTQVFTVNIVSRAMVEAMNVCATPFEPAVDELAEAGLTPLPGVKVACPGIMESPAVFECRHHTTLSIGKSREIILGEIVHAHFHDDVVDAKRFYVHPEPLDAIGRMGGHSYTTTRDLFDLPTMTLEDWAARQVRDGRYSSGE